MKVLSHYHVSSEPVPVRVWVNNPVARRLVESGQADSIATNDDAWTVGIGYLLGKPAPILPTSSNKFPAHLVTYVANRYLLDVTIDVASRPEKNIILPPLYLDVGKNFNSVGKWYSCNNHITGISLQYSYAHELEGAWCHSPAWIDEKYMEEPTRRIISALREMGLE